ncbi:MAG TPA: radical SAM protein [Candidatus Eremiobacteraceae bacterium]|nr:radical SAM protein [Candidatus Eremiobacteraceae bacterium]
MIGLAYCDKAGRIFYDEKHEPLADGGIVRRVGDAELLPAPPGTVPMVLPLRHPRLRKSVARRRQTLAVMLPSGYTRLLLPAYERDPDAPALPLFGYTFACAIDEQLHVAAMRTDESEDWQPRHFKPGQLERLVENRLNTTGQNRVLRQLALCSLDYHCFTAQNVFLERGEAALPVSPTCNARCVGCISEQEPGSGVPSPQTRIAEEMTARELAQIAVHHLERVPDGIVSFGQGCEGEPLLRSVAIAKAIELIRRARTNGTINLNTNGSLPPSLQRCIDAGLQSVRVSLNSFRPAAYAAYYRPIGYDLSDVFASIRLASDAGLRVSLNLLTHPGVTDDVAELEAMRAFLRTVKVDMIQTRTLNIDPEWYFATVGRPAEVAGMREAIAEMRGAGVRVGNFTHTH